MEELDWIVRDARLAGTEPADLAVAVRNALGLAEGYVLGWRATGCQLVSLEYRRLLTCPYREARWQCEVIGPHTVHRWSEHLKVHERMGNGYPCGHVGDLTLAELYGRDPAGPTPLHVVGV